MIESKRGGDVGLQSESNQTDAVAGAFADEASQNFLDHFQTVRRLTVNLKILRPHAAGQINGDNDVNATCGDPGLALRQAWLSQCDDA